MLTYRAIALYCVASSNNACQKFRSKRLYSGTFSSAYIVDYQENAAIVHGFVRYCNRWTTLARAKGTRSALGKIECTEIITSTIKLLVQLKGVKEWIEQLAL